MWNEFVTPVIGNDLDGTTFVVDCVRSLPRAVVLILVWLAIGCHFAGGCVPCRQLAWQMAEKLRALANSGSYGRLMEGPGLFTADI
jgi:hypothetical protein